MRILVVGCLFVACVTQAASQVVAFDRFFIDSTLRVDYYHTGTKGQEVFSLDQVVREGPWAGSRRNLVDTLNLGEYLARVYDRASGALIYSRGYCTMFNEWQTTGEAGTGAYRTFSESIRMPMARRAVQLTIARRDRQMLFRELWSCVIDPADPTQVRKEALPAAGKVVTLLESGPPAEKVDIVVLGDGYAQQDMGKFRKDAARFTDALFSTPPFGARKGDFNVRAVEAASAESGIDVPDKNVWKGNRLGTRYNTFGSARYVLTEENKTLRDVAASAPYDFICILVNDTRYGGGGIYNLYTTTYTGETTKGQEWRMDYVYVHEFGHSFGGLGDEYYTSSTAYSDFYVAGVEPWEPNVAGVVEGGRVKWQGLVSAGTAVPTPWEKAPYDSIEALRQKLDRLAADYYQKQEPLHRASMEILRTSKAAGKVGAFEGAGYAAKGLYRPSVDCRMFSLSLGGFDPVCSAAIERVIGFYAR